MSDIWGQTPLTLDERAGLKPRHIHSRAELDEAEADNIRQAMMWLARARRAPDPLSVGFMRRLHKHMYGHVWRWAGQFSRERDRGIGLDAGEIEPALRTLIDDARAWIRWNSFADIHELLASFHHRLTRIHPFPNGNGRWARLMTDILSTRLDGPRIRWGGAVETGALHHHDIARRRYVEALRAADVHDMRPLTALLEAWAADGLATGARPGH